MPDLRRCVFGCVTNGIVLHNFPNPTRFPERFKLWVNLVGEPVENLAPSEIYGKKKVCDLHFTADDRNRNNRLNAIAVPVPFPYQKRPQIKRHRRLYTSSTSLITQTDVLHHFPKPVKASMERFLQWKEIAGQHAEGKTNEDIYNNLRFCNNHFEKQFLYSTKRLAKTACPTLKLELYRDPDLDPDEESGTTSKEQVEVDDASDDVSLYVDDKEPTSPPQTVKYDVDPTLHEGFQCDVCKGEIRGFRYTCVQCSDFDLCSACELNKAHHHHYVLRVPQRRPYTEIQLVLATIRRHLMKQLDPITDEQDYNDNVSIKSEVKSESEDDEECNEKIFSQDMSHLTDTSTRKKQTDNNEDQEMNLQEEKESVKQIVKQNNSPSSKSTQLIYKEQQNQIIGKPKPPIVLSTAKKKIIIKLDEFMKGGLPSAKKIRVLPIAKNKSDNKTQTVLTHKPQFKPVVNKMMLVKLPGTILKDAPKVPIQKLLPSTAMKHSADVDNG